MCLLFFFHQSYTFYFVSSTMRLCYLFSTLNLTSSFTICWKHPLLVPPDAFSSGTFMSSLGLYVGECVQSSLITCCFESSSYSCLRHTKRLAKFTPCKSGPSCGKTFQGPSLRSLIAANTGTLFHLLLMVHSNVGRLEMFWKSFKSIVILHLPPKWQIHLVYLGPNLSNTFMSDILCHAHTPVPGETLS